MDSQIDFYHNLSAFYLGPEQELKAEIAQLKQKLADEKKESQRKENELRDRAYRERRFGHQEGYQEGDKAGYERGYEESIEEAQGVFDFDIKDEIEALKALTLPQELYSRILDICHVSYQRGWTAARKLFAVTYHCTHCRRIIEVNTKDEKRAARSYLEEHRWQHKTCPKR